MADPDPYAQLNPRQRAFVDHLIRTGNQSEAARAAGYRGDAKVIGSRLLTNVNVKAAVESRQAVVENKRIADATEVQELLSDIARDETHKDRLGALNTLAKIKIPELRQRNHEHDIGDRTRETLAAIFRRAAAALR